MCDGYDLRSRCRSRQDLYVWSAILVIVLVMKELGRVRQSWSIERWFTELGPECRPKEWNAEESGSDIDSKVLIVFGSISLVFSPAGMGRVE